PLPAKPGSPPPAAPGSGAAGSDSEPSEETGASGLALSTSGATGVAQSVPVSLSLPGGQAALSGPPAAGGSTPPVAAQAASATTNVAIRTSSHSFELVMIPPHAPR